MQRLGQVAQLVPRLGDEDAAADEEERALGLRQRLGRLRLGVGLARRQPLFLPPSGEFLGYRRLRDWLRLLSFEVEAGRFGCYRLPVASERWLQRCAWMDEQGERWWPVFGAAYFVVAVKRVRGMTLLGPAWKTARALANGPVSVLNSHGAGRANVLDDWTKRSED